MATDTTAPKPKPPLAVEVCCGHAGLSLALHAQGWDVRPVDWIGNAHHQVLPVLNYDLTDQLQVHKLLRIIGRASYVHMAPPCGTASQARERPCRTVSGRPPPKPLRSEAWPTGLPDLNGQDKQKVLQANKIYDAIALIMTTCHDKSIPFTVENPRKSHMWNYPAIATAINDIETWEVDFQACMYPDPGRDRRDKWTRLITNNATFKSLAVECDGKHEHAPWGQVWEGQWTWATKLECEYTEALCKAMATAATKLVSNKPLPTPLPKKGRRYPTRTQELIDVRAGVGRQTRHMHKAHVPERKPTRDVRIETDKDHDLQPGKIEQDIQVGPLSIPKGSLIESVSKKKVGTNRGHRWVTHVKYSPAWSTEEFINECKQTKVPWTQQAVVPEKTLKNEVHGGPP